MAQSVAPGSTWAKSGLIKLTISDGPLLTTINMPNVIGKTSTEAKALLEKNNLVVLVEPQNSTTSPEDVVISTTPKPGESVVQGTEVTMAVSIGPGPLAQGIDPKAALAQIVGVVSKNGKIKPQKN